MGNDDWRVRVSFDDEQHGPHLVQSLQELDLESDTHAALGARVTITGDEKRIFLYSASEASIRETERIVREVLGKSQVAAELIVQRWHPIAESWEDPSVPMPMADAEKLAEHEQLEKREADESRESGFAEWELELEFDNRHEAAEAAEKFASEGLRSIRRWRYVFLGAANEDEARELAERVKGDLPDNVRIEVTLSGKHILDSMPSNPFAFLGGLGG